MPLGPSDGPYIQYSIQRTHLGLAWNPNYPEDARCQCGHIYYRHFDTYEDMYPCGCKYCQCFTFIPMEDAKTFEVQRDRVIHTAGGYALVACYYGDKFGYAVGKEAPKADFRGIKFFPKTTETSYQDALDYLRDLSRP